MTDGAAEGARAPVSQVIDNTAAANQASQNAAAQAGSQVQATHDGATTALSTGTGQANELTNQDAQAVRAALPGSGSPPPTNMPAAIGPYTEVAPGSPSHVNPFALPADPRGANTPPRPEDRLPAGTPVGHPPAALPSHGARPARTRPTQLRRRPIGARAHHGDLLRTPDSSNSDANSPDSNRPDFNRPDFSRPDSSRPDFSRPGTTAGEPYPGPENSAAPWDPSAHRAEGPPSQSGPYDNHAFGAPSQPPMAPGHPPAIPDHAAAPSDPPHQNRPSHSDYSPPQDHLGAHSPYQQPLAPSPPPAPYPIGPAPGTGGTGQSPWRPNGPVLRGDGAVPRTSPQTSTPTKSKLRRTRPAAGTSSSSRLSDRAHSPLRAPLGRPVASRRRKAIPGRVRALPGNSPMARRRQAPALRSIPCRRAGSIRPIRPASRGGDCPWRFAGRRPKRKPDRAPVRCPSRCADARRRACPPPLRSQRPTTNGRSPAGRTDAGSSVKSFVLGDSQPPPPQGATTGQGVPQPPAVGPGQNYAGPGQNYVGPPSYGQPTLPSYPSPATPGGFDNSRGYRLTEPPAQGMATQGPYQPPMVPSTPPAGPAGPAPQQASQPWYKLNLW